LWVAFLHENTYFTWMKKYSSLDLQQRTGEIQAAALRSPVALTFHGRPRTVMLAVDEFCRLKDIAGEPVPAKLRQAAPEVLGPLPEDVLGYDTADPVAAVVRMAHDAIRGVNQSQVSSEAKRFAALFGKGAA
jgi:hypothetical protein